jgi:hypothetical protein
VFRSGDESFTATGKAVIAKAYLDWRREGSTDGAANVNLKDLAMKPPKRAGSQESVDPCCSLKYRSNYRQEFEHAYHYKFNTISFPTERRGNVPLESLRLASGSSKRMMDLLSSAMQQCTIPASLVSRHRCELTGHSQRSRP